MTLNPRFYLKCDLRTVRKFSVSEPTMRDWMNTGLNYISDRNVANKTVVSERMRFVRFLTRVSCRGGATNRNGAAKILISWDTWTFVICIIMKAFNDFLITKKHATLKDIFRACNVRKLYRSHRTDAFLTDMSMTFTILVVQHLQRSVNCKISNC